MNQKYLTAIFLLIFIPISGSIFYKKIHELKQHNHSILLELDTLVSDKKTFKNVLTKDFKSISSFFAWYLKKHQLVHGVVITRNNEVLNRTIWGKYPNLANYDSSLCSLVPESEVMVCALTSNGSHIVFYSLISIFIDNFLLLFVVALFCLLITIFINDFNSSLTSSLDLIKTMNTGQLKIAPTKNYLFFHKFKSDFSNASIKAKEMLKQQANTLAATFTAQSIAHDIKSPIDSMIIAVKLLKEELEANDIQLNEEKSNVVKFSINAGEFANICIDDLYTMGSQIELKKTTLKIDDESHSILNILKENRTFIGKNLTIDLDKCTVFTDRSILRVVFNLLKNSGEACPIGGTVCFKIKKSEDGILFSISNTGLKIDDSKINKIWAPFFSEKDHGRGFGLAIVKKILRLHSIEPQVESNNDYTTFSFTVKSIG